MPRRLPVLKTTPPEEAEAEARPPWHWAAIGAVLTFFCWLPLAMLGGWIGKQLVRAIVPTDERVDVAAFLASSASARVEVLLAIVLPQAICFALAAGGAGALVGRFGGRAGAREAAVGAFGAAAVAWLLTAAEGGLRATWFLLPTAALVGIGAGWVGGRLGVRARR